MFEVDPIVLIVGLCLDTFGLLIIPNAEFTAALEWALNYFLRIWLPEDCNGLFGAPDC